MDNKGCEYAQLEGPRIETVRLIGDIISAVFMSLSAGVASDFTVKNAWRVSLAVLMAALTIFALTTFGGAITGLMPASI